MVLEILVERQSDELARSLESEEFTQLYRRTYAPLVEHCRKRLGAGDDAEDIAQAALIKAWRSWQHYDNDRPFWPWVVTIARRLAIDTYRRSSRQDGLCASLQDGDSPTVSPEDAVALKADAALALAALRQLRPQEQRLIGLRDLEGWSYDELADFEGESVDRVRRHTHRARQALRASYLRVSQNLAGLAIAGWAARARRRLASLTARVPTAMAPASPIVDGGVQALSGLCVLALALTAAAPGVVERRDAIEPVGSPSAAAPAGAPTSIPPAVAAPTPAPAGSRSSLQALGLDALAVPEDAAFDSFTPAPDGQTIFATGSGNGTCGAARCIAIFRSTDAGATWSRLAGEGYLGGPLMLPPSYPADSRIFVAGPVALQVSEDGGATFMNLSTVGGPAAMSPEFSNGDPRILIGAAPGWVYDDADRSIRPLTSVTSPPSLSRTFAFSPTFRSDGRMLVGGTSSPLGGADVSTVTLCDGAGCLSVASLDALTGTPQLTVSPRYAVDGTVLAWRPNGLYRSVDGGRSFQAVSLPTAGVISALVPAGGSGFLLTLQPDFATSAGGGVFRSADGVTWHQLGGLSNGIATAAQVGDRILAGPAWQYGGGLRCSLDGGTSWRPRCA